MILGRSLKYSGHSIIGLNCKGEVKRSEQATKAKHCRNTYRVSDDKECEESSRENISSNFNRSIASDSTNDCLQQRRPTKKDGSKCKGDVKIYEEAQDVDNLRNASRSSSVQSSEETPGAKDVENRCGGEKPSEYSQVKKKIDGLCSLFKTKGADKVKNVVEEAANCGNELVNKLEEEKESSSYYEKLMNSQKEELRNLLSKEKEWLEDRKELTTLRKKLGYTSMRKARAKSDWDSSISSESVKREVSDMERQRRQVIGNTVCLNDVRWKSAYLPDDVDKLKKKLCRIDVALSLSKDTIESLKEKHCDEMRVVSAELSKIRRHLNNIGCE